MSYSLSLTDGQLSGTASGSGDVSLSGLAGLSSSQLASLQTPAAQVAAANKVSVGPTGVTPSKFVGGNQVQLPDWLNTNADSNLSELLSSYGQIGSAFDPTAQTEARNKSIGYEVGAGTQAANNAANEYVNRAAQSGGSALGAGAVRAQAMMPVYKRASDLRTEAADAAAKTKQEGLSLQSQIAKTISDLRESHYSMLANYAASQSQVLTQNNQFNSDLALKNYQAQQAVATSSANTQLGYAQTQAGLYKDALSAATNEKNQALQAANLLTNKANAPSGNYITDQWGRVTSGQDAYNKIKDYGQYQQQAYQSLGGMLKY